MLKVCESHPSLQHEIVNICAEREWWVFLRMSHLRIASHPSPAADSTHAVDPWAGRCPADAAGTSSSAAETCVLVELWEARFCTQTAVQQLHWSVS